MSLKSLNNYNKNSVFIGVKNTTWISKIFYCQVFIGLSMEKCLVTNTIKIIREPFDEFIQTDFFPFVLIYLICSTDWIINEIKGNTLILETCNVRNKYVKNK